MIFECDPDKDEANRIKHGVQLLFGAQIFDDPHVAIIPTLRIDDEEVRFKAIGVVDRRLWTAIHVWRGDVARLISVRRSNPGEQRGYDRNPGGSQ